MSLEELPRPASNFASRRIQLIELREILFRTHSVTRSSLAVGKSGFNRFDAPDQSYDVLYLGRDAYCAFIETFAHSAGTKIVATAALKSNALSQLRPKRSLRLIDLVTSGALVRVGADARLFSTAYAMSQAWSKALHDHPCRAHGLLYPSRLDPHRHSIALFLDRAPKLMEVNTKDWYTLGDQRLLLAEMVEHYAIELIENHFARRKPLGG